MTYDPTPADKGKAGWHSRVPLLTGPHQDARSRAARLNMHELILLRWIAIGGQLVSILVAVGWLGVPLPLVPMLTVIALEVAVNGWFMLRLRTHEPAFEFTLALTFDVACLTLLLFLSGGAGNPFSFLFLIHVVLGSILLTPRRAGAFALGCVIAYCAISLRFRPLDFAGRSPDEIARLLTIGRWWSFALVVALLTLLTGRINHNLRLRDLHLSELGQKRAEEDAIMRMGLFASGAAHELGTPLSSIAVLIADWKRHPDVANRADLLAEMKTAMQEVDRCKRIVTDILLSSGHVRSEELKLVNAEPHLRGVVKAWQKSRPGHPVEVKLRDARHVYIAFQPAFEQAIFSILDNAVAADAATIRFESARAGEELLLSVIDDGDGFPDHVLHGVGKPVQSAKGDGHGVGLFLASNVARQLGGHLRVMNRDEGGATVEIALPIIREGTNP